MDWAERGSVLAAVLQNGRALGHAAEALKANREIVLAAVPMGRQIKTIKMGFTT